MPPDFARGLAQYEGVLPQARVKLAEFAEHNPPGSVLIFRHEHFESVGDEDSASEYWVEGDEEGVELEDRVEAAGGMKEAKGRVVVLGVGDGAM